MPGAVTELQSERVGEILRAACRVVVRDGAHGLRMASVATEAGVSKALVHYYFSTRRELLRASVAYADARWHESVDAATAELPTGAAKLTRALLVPFETGTPFDEHRVLWNEVWSSLRVDEELRPVVEAFYAGWHDRLVGFLEEGRKDGSVAAGVGADDAAWRLTATADGLDSMRYLDLVAADAASILMREAIERELGAS
jgi:AcrR family transcriptional regulator